MKYIRFNRATEIFSSIRFFEFIIWRAVLEQQLVQIAERPLRMFRTAPYPNPARNSRAQLLVLTCIIRPHMVKRLSRRLSEHRIYFGNIVKARVPSFDARSTEQLTAKAQQRITDNFFLDHAD